MEGDLNKADLKRMWKLSEMCTPDSNYDVYTQAIMDLEQQYVYQRNMIVLIALSMKVI